VFPVFLLEPVLDLNDFNLRSCVLFVFLSSSVSGNRSSVANRVLLCTVFVFPVELPSFAMARKFHRRRCFLLWSFDPSAGSAQTFLPNHFVFFCSSHRRALVTRFVRPSFLRSCRLPPGWCSSSAASAWLIPCALLSSFLCVFGFLRPSFDQWVIVFAGSVLLSKNSGW
jgi:hypothetical protein